jgi:hypothetical protein
VEDLGEHLNKEYGWEEVDEFDPEDLQYMPKNFVPLKPGWICGRCIDDQEL